MHAMKLHGLHAQLKQDRDVQTQERHKTYQDVQVGQRYATQKNGLTTYVWVEAVKRKDVVLKRSPTAKDSFTENRTRFDKFYVHSPE